MRIMTAPELDNISIPWSTRADWHDVYPRWTEHMDFLHGMYITDLKIIRALRVYKYVIVAIVREDGSDAFNITLAQWMVKDEPPGWLRTHFGKTWCTLVSAGNTDEINDYVIVESEIHKQGSDDLELNQDKEYETV